MAKRKLVQIDETKCDGCGECVPACAEGAIEVVDGKARLVSEVYCDGLGACLGHCSRGAISIAEVDARPFDEAAVRERRDAPDAGRAATAGLGRGGGEGGSRAPLAVEGFPISPGSGGGCPGSRSQAFEAEKPAGTGRQRGSALSHWPVQMHLISPHAPQYQGADLLLCADCVPFALADFHRDLLHGRALAIACPKLDKGQASYVDKLVALIDEAQIRSLRVVVMEVPCCNGLVALARAALERSRRDIPIELEVISVRGERRRDAVA